MDSEDDLGYSVESIRIILSDLADFFSKNMNVLVLWLYHGLSEMLLSLWMCLCQKGVRVL
jgi:hypothetical protein